MRSCARCTVSAHCGHSVRRRRRRVQTGKRVPDIAASLSPLAVSAAEACASASVESACGPRLLERRRAWVDRARDGEQGPVIVLQMLYSAGLGLEGSFSAGVAAGGSGADDSALTDRSVTDLRMKFLDYTREPSGGWWRTEFVVKTMRDQATRSLSLSRCGSWRDRRPLRGGCRGAVGLCCRLA